ncbi:methylglutaconyl-CoA hydratase-like [Sarcoptes scabiei]|nr:methylglutaconyl-CoA hydratase-like [Sarcoptes scabiei]
MCDEEIFEINDYSTSSDWERFISDLEEILTLWNLNNNISGEHDSVPIDTTSLEHSSPSITKSSQTNNNEVNSKFLADHHRWQQKQESIRFGKVSFSLQYFYFKKNSPEHSLNQTESSNLFLGFNEAWRNMNSIQNDWPASGHPLVRYYGLTQFLVLSPLNGETISTEDRARHLIGSAAIALHSIDCEVPFFCQISNLSRRLYIGVGHLSNGFRTYFEMILLPESSQFQYLNELLTLFKNKLHSSFSYGNNRIHNDEDEREDFDEAWKHHNPINNDQNKSKICVSIRFTYILSKWSSDYLLYDVIGPSKTLLESFFIQKFSYFRNSPFDEEMFHQILPRFDQMNGDPCEQIQLATTWPLIAEELITDNAYHTDLQPENAPKWSVRALFMESNKSHRFCWIVKIFQLFLRLTNNHQSIMSFLSEEQIKNDVRPALDRLSSSTVPLPINANQLINSVSNMVLSETFHSDPSEIENLVKKIFQKGNDLNTENEKKQWRQLKSTWFDSLPWRLVNLCSNLYFENQQISILARVWKFFVLNLREHWQNGQSLSQIESVSEINHQNCIFHQKLHLLNCCIAQKIKREHCEKNFSTKKDDDSDEEFFDAEDFEQSNIEAEDFTGVLYDKDGENVLCLLDQPNQPIRIPMTQDPAPMTEEELAKQIATLSSIDDPKIQIRSQSSSLLSDMEAFKAANPQCRFEDFIRWHSPRDWIELCDDDCDNFNAPNYGLSKRMQESDTWKELWSMAKPLPVRKQKRLFNYTKEAEEILQYFEKITIGNLIQLFIPIIGKSILLKLSQYCNEIMSLIESNIDTKMMKSDQLQIFRLEIDNYIKLFQNLNNESNRRIFLEKILQIEISIIKFYSILQKLGTSYSKMFKRLKFSNLFENQPDTDQPSNSLEQQRNNLGQKLTKFARSKIEKSDDQLSGSKLIRFILSLITEPEVELCNTDPICPLIISCLLKINVILVNNC